MKRGAVLSAVFVAVFAVATPAFAHVTVSAPGATSGGGDQEITFRVPVEEDKPTIGVTVALPTDTPIASVDVEAMPGWKHTQKTVKLAKPIKTDDGDITEAVSTITWTATDGGLQPGEFGDFTIIAGQLPEVSSLTFPTLQTYQGGTVVKWTERAAPGSAEPENPAPVLDLDAASDPSSSGSPSVSAAPVAQDKTSTTAPTVLAIIALVVAVAALGYTVVSRAKRS